MKKILFWALILWFGFVNLSFAENFLNLWDFLTIYFEWISEDIPEYYDTYVTMPTFNDRRIVSSNQDPTLAITEAENKAFPNPVLVFYSDPNKKYDFPESSSSLEWIQLLLRHINI